MTDCKNCLHVAVCARYSATGGMVKKCQHFAEDINVHTWISVTERLPNEWEDVLVYSSCDFCCVAVWLGIKEKNWWRERFTHIKFDTVTHWMPLPEAPKQDKPSCERCTNDGMDVPHCKECPGSGFIWFREKV